MHLALLACVWKSNGEITSEISALRLWKVSNTENPNVKPRKGGRFSSDKTERDIFSHEQILSPPPLWGNHRQGGEEMLLSFHLECCASPPLSTCVLLRSSCSKIIICNQTFVSLLHHSSASFLCSPFVFSPSITASSSLHYSSFLPCASHPPPPPPPRRPAELQQAFIDQLNRRR